MMTTTAICVLLAAQAIGAKDPIPTTKAYATLAFEAPADRELQEILVALRKEEPELSRDEKAGATKDDDNAASAAADRCNALEEKFNKKAGAGTSLRLLDHLLAALAEGAEAGACEIYMLDALGKTLEPEGVTLFKLREEEWRPLFTTLLAKGTSARKRWKDGDAARLYVGLSTEVMKIQFKTMAEKPPAVPVAEAKDWDAQVARFTDWVRERLAKGK